MASIEFFNEPKKFYDVVLDETNEVTQVRIMSDDVLMVRYKGARDFVESHANTSIVIAAFVTSQARLHLYSYIDCIGAGTLYCTLLYFGPEGEKPQRKHLELRSLKQGFSSGEAV